MTTSCRIRIVATSQFLIRSDYATTLSNSTHFSCDTSRVYRRNGITITQIGVLFVQSRAVGIHNDSNSRLAILSSSLIKHVTPNSYASFPSRSSKQLRHISTFSRRILPNTQRLQTPSMGPLSAKSSAVPEIWKATIRRLATASHSKLLENRRPFSDAPQH